MELKKHRSENQADWLHSCPIIHEDVPVQTFLPFDGIRSCLADPTLQTAPRFPSARTLGPGSFSPSQLAPAGSSSTLWAAVGKGSGIALFSLHTLSLGSLTATCARV